MGELSVSGVANVAPVTPIPSSTAGKIENGFLNIVDPQTKASACELGKTHVKTSPSYPPSTHSFSLDSLHVENVHVRECLAECLGTFVLLAFGMGVNNQVVNSKDANGRWLSITMCWGIGILVGIFCSEGVSGGHLNPAVTITQAVYGRHPWKKVPGYIAAQVVGAFLGAFMIYVLQYENLNEVDPKRTMSQSNFATYPADQISNYTAFYTEFAGTGMLLLGIFAITDARNRAAGSVATPFALALLFMAMGMSFGMNTGFALNPARDFGPRLFTSMAGWGSKVFTLRDYYFWIPIVAPVLGGITGAGFYRVMVEVHHPKQD